MSIRSYLSFNPNVGVANLQGMANTELQFEMAMRDQVIYNQREVVRNMWDLLMGLGLDERRILDLAAKRGIAIEDWTMAPHHGLSTIKQSSELAFGRNAPSGYFPGMGLSYARQSCIFEQCQDSGSSSMPEECHKPTPAFCREEHHSSYFVVSHDHSPSAYMRMRKSSEHWVGGRSNICFSTLDKHPQDLRRSCPELRIHTSPYGESCISASALTAANFSKQQMVWIPEKLNQVISSFLVERKNNVGWSRIYLAVRLELLSFMPLHIIANRFYSSSSSHLLLALEKEFVIVLCINLTWALCHTEWMERYFQARNVQEPSFHNEQWPR